MKGYHSIFALIKLGTETREKKRYMDSGVGGWVGGRMNRWMGPSKFSRGKCERKEGTWANLPPSLTPNTHDH